MYELNILQHTNMQNLHISNDLSLSILKDNQTYFDVQKEFLKRFKFESLNYFSFSKEGFLSILLELSKKGKIAISKGETHFLYEAGKSFEKLGFEVFWIDLTKSGKVDEEQIKGLEVDFIFLSSYIMDTFIKTNLEDIKKLTNAKIISNASANFDKNSDIIYFDLYKLTGYALNSMILFNDDFFEEQTLAQKDSIALYTLNIALKNQNFNTSVKNLFQDELIKAFEKDIYFFVNNEETLSYSLHFALKNIKAREIIRTLALDDIYITNGEGCSLGLSKPSRIIQTMGYDESTSRNAISLSFNKDFTKDEIKNIVNKMAKKYRQILVLNKGI